MVDQRAVVVVSGDGRLRETWARAFEGQGLRAMRCAGPEVTSCALLIMDRCPLHAAADIAVYDVDSVTPALLKRLRRPFPHTEIVFAKKAQIEALAWRLRACLDLAQTAHAPMIGARPRGRTAGPPALP